MEILHSEVVPVRPGTAIDYDHNNPVARLLSLVEGAALAAGREAVLRGQAAHALVLVVEDDDDAVLAEGR